MKPMRIQLSRRAGFNLQKYSMELNGLPAVNVARPSKWGNRFKIGKVCEGVFISDAQMAVDYHRAFVDKGLMRIRIKQELGGKNVACFCGPDEPCHGDTLLEIANA